MIIPLRTAAILFVGFLLLGAAVMIGVVQTSIPDSGEEEGLTVISYGMHVCPADTDALAGQLRVLAEEYYPWMLDLKISPGTVDNCKRFGTVITQRYSVAQDLVVLNVHVPVRAIRVILPSEFLCTLTRYPNSDTVGSYILMSEDGVHFPKVMWLSEEKVNTLLAMI